MLKASLLRLAVLGASFALTLAITILIAYWFMTRPVPQKPWDTKAITSAFDRALIIDDELHPAFSYTLVNNTTTDYQFIRTNIIANAKLKAERSLSPSDDGPIVIDNEALLPSNQRVQIILHLSNYQLPAKLKARLDLASRSQKDSIVSKFLRDEIPNLDGFVLLDKQHRYHIELPRGW